jgi:hypothetical protein
MGFKTNATPSDWDGPIIRNVGPGIVSKKEKIRAFRIFMAASFVFMCGHKRFLLI